MIIIITIVANVGFMLHYIGGDCSFTSYIILLVHVSNRQTSCHGELVGLRDDSRQSRVPRKPSDWRGASESSAGRTGLIYLVARGVGQWISEREDVF